MPTYQYRCADCGHFFEQVQSFSDDSLTVCPECQGVLRKVFNAVGVVFKGSGFYKTDSRGSSSAATTSSSAGSADSSSAASGSTAATSGAGASSSSSASSASAGSSTATAAS